LESRGFALARVPVRVRELGVTLGAWRLSVAADEGEGGITMVDASPGTVLYRGDGIFLGWPQQRLEEAYAALAPRDEAALPDLPQLG
jgi:hypothetical protein